MSRLSQSDIAALINATHREPRSVLGYHEMQRAGQEPECVVRVLEPDATYVGIYWEDQTPGEARPLVQLHPSGVFEGVIDFRRPIMPYRLHIRYRNGAETTKYDPYYFGPQITEFDLHLFGEGNHHTIYCKLGAHAMTRDGLAGTRFAVWAPNAKRVSAVGDFNFWDGRRHPMHALAASGIWELFIPGVGAGALYKFEILTPQGHVVLKSDPYGFQTQLRPDN